MDIDEDLHEEFAEFPAFFKNEIGDTSLSFGDDENRDIELLQRNLETLIKYPNVHQVAEVEKKVQKVVEETQICSHHYDNLCRAIQRDMKKKIQLEQMIKLAEYIMELEEMFDSLSFLDDLDKVGRDGVDDLSKQLDSFVIVNKFKKIKQIQAEEAELIRLANVATPINLEHKWWDVLHEKVAGNLLDNYLFRAYIQA